jgi:hypothetical protein
VTKQKIKSKWKAQKRRDGIVTQRDALSRQHTLDVLQQTRKSTAVCEERSVPTDKAESDENDGERQHSPSDEKVLTAPVQKNEQRTRIQRQNAPGNGPSLRELQKQAYSPASLHHFKSRSLHRPKSRKTTRSAEVSGSFQKGGVCRSRGGGQPDMRLRMSAMLEKIKHDYS